MYNRDVGMQLIDPPPWTDVPHFIAVMRCRSWGTDWVMVQPVVNGQPYGSPHDLVEGTTFAEEMRRTFARREAIVATWRASGWPMLALSAEVWWKPFGRDYIYPVKGGILVSAKEASPQDAVKALPLTPIWSGLITNTAFFTSLWLGLFYAPAIFRRVRGELWRRRGQCMTCGYKLLGDQAVCSECGIAVAR